MENSRIKLSVVIPVYKAEAFLEKCLLSVLNQEVDRCLYDVIIVNDGSPDNSQVIIDDFCKKYDNVKSITQKNQGPSVARNNGADCARGEYIWFVDSDDWVASDSIKRIIEASITQPEVISIARAKNDSSDLHTGSYTISGREKLQSKNFEHGAVFYVVRRDFVESNNLRFLQGIYHEDSEYTPRMLYLADKVQVLDGPLYYVRVNPCSITHSVNPKKSYDLLVVSERLYRFKQERVNESAIQKKFDYLISVALNNALNNILQSDTVEQQKFNDAMYEARNLWPSLRKSHLKYRVEYALFSLFPKHTVELYRLMKFTTK